MRKKIQKLIIPIMVLFFTMGSAYADTWTVNPDGTGNYTTIQAAINGASPGDIIEVAAGTYDEALTIQKSISLIGEDSSNTIITYTNGSSTVEQLVMLGWNTGGDFTNGVKIEGFKLIGDIGLDGDKDLIKLRANGTSTDSIIIKGNVFKGDGTTRYLGIETSYDAGYVSVENNNFDDLAYGAWFNVLTNSTFKGNTITDAIWSSLAINTSAVGNTHDVEITGNSIIRNGTGSGSPEWSAAIHLGSTVSDIDINGNNIVDSEDYGFYIMDRNNVDLTNVSITGNEIYNNALGNHNEVSVTVNATCNWWATTDPFQIEDMVSGDVEFLPYSTSASPTNCNGLGPVVNTTQSLGYMTIQAAIDEADPSDVIEVADGTYEEDIEISNSITLQSVNGKDNTTIEGVMPGDNGNIQVSADNITIDGFTIEGNKKPVRLLAATNGFKFVNNKLITGDNSVSPENGWVGIESNWDLLHSGMEVDNNVFVANNTAQLIYINNTPDAIFTNNTLEGTMYSGGLPLGLGTFDGSQTITGNTFNLTSSYALIEVSGTYDIYGILENNNWPQGGVATGNKVHNTIQAAINAATAGDEIDIKAGTYTETLNLDSKQLTITGAGSSQTIIDAVGSTGYAIKNFADGTTIEDLQLINSQHYGFKVAGVSNITLTDILVENSAKTGIDLNGVNNATLTNVEINNTAGGFGLMIGNSNNITVNGVTTSNNAWAGVTVQSWGGAYTGGCDNIDFQGTFNASDTYPLLIEKDSDGGTYYPITNVTIPDQFDYIAYGFRSGDDYKQWFYAETLAEAKTIADGLATSSSHTYLDVIIYNIDETNYYVTENLLIQDAIDAASSGDVIDIDAGTYNEQLHITTSNLTINGEGTDDVIVKSPANLTHYYTTGNDNYPVVFVDGGDGCTIKNLTVDGDNQGNSNYRFQGIAYWNAGGTMENLEVINVMDNPFSGAQHGVAVYSYNNTGGPYTLNVTNVDVEDFQKNAFSINGDGLTVTMSDCDVVGAGPTDVTAQNGIQFWGDSDVDVSNCTIDGIDYTGATWTASALLNYSASVEADGISISNSQTSVYNYGGDLTFENGSITDPTGDGIYAWNFAAVTGGNPVLKAQVYGTGTTGASRSGTIDVSISNTMVDGSNEADSWGVSAIAEDGATVNLDIEQCTISNWDYAIYAYDYDTEGGGIIDLEAHNNDLSLGNTYGFGSNDDEDQNANCNWWGTFVQADIDAMISLDGTGAVTHDNVLLNSTIDPTDPNYNCGTPLGNPIVNLNTLVTYTEIQPAIDDAAAGDVIEVAPGEYLIDAQISVDKDLSLQGVDKNTTILKADLNMTGGSGDDPGMILVDPDVEFNFKNFTLDGDYPNREVRMALITYGTNGTIENNIIKNFRYSTYFGRGVVVYGTNINVQENTFSNIGRIGIQVRNDYVVGTYVGSAMISNNEYTGKGEGDYLDYGIEVGGSASATITGNTFTDCKGIATSDGSTSAGVYANDYFAVGTEVDVQNNTFADNYAGVRVGYDTDDATTATISGNTFTNHSNNNMQFTTNVVVDLDATFTGNTYDNCVVITDGTNILAGADFYTHIQDAIDAAADGDIIEVNDGTYEEEITLNKANITVKSVNGSALTIIDTPDGTLTTSVTAEANMGTLVFDGFKVTGFTEGGIIQAMSSATGTTFKVYNNEVIPADDYMRNGIQVSGDGSEIIGNTVQGAPLTEDWAGTALMVVNASNVSVESNTVIGDSDIGISFLNWNVATVENITIDGNDVSGAGDGIRISGYSNPEPHGVVTNVTITNNILENNEKGINAQTVQLSDLTVTGNQISNNTEQGIRFSETSATLSGDILIDNNDFLNNTNEAIYNGASYNIDGTCNWFGTDNFAQIDAMITGDVTWTPYLQTAEGPCGGDQPVHNTTQDIYYTTIQSAIDDANAGDVIEVAAGTYQESLSIDIGLTLNGAQKDTDPRGDVWTSDISLIDANGASQGILIESSDVTINGFKVTGAAGDNVNSGGGIVVDAASALSGIIIKYNWLDNNSSNGLYMSNVEDPIVEYNYASNNGEEGDNIAGFSLYASGSKVFENGSVSHNEVYNNINYGIYLASAANAPNTVTAVLIDDNLIHDNAKYGMQMLSHNNASAVTLIELTNNEFYDNVRNGLKLVDATNCTIDNNKFYQNGADASSDKYKYGLMIETDDGSGVLDASGNSLSGNEFYSNTLGGVYIHGSGDVTNTTFRNNKFTEGSSKFGINNLTTTDVDAYRNWWGDATGPYHDPGNTGGLGSEVSDYVLFDPWWEDAAMTELHTVGILIPGHNCNLFTFNGTGVKLQFECGTNTSDQTITIGYNGQNPDGLGDNFGDDLEILDAYWEITSTEVIPGTYSITFDVSDVPGIKNIARLHLLKRPDGGAPADWEDMGTATEASLENYPELTWEGLDRFSEFAIANGDQVDIAVHQTECATFEAVIKPTNDIGAGTEITNLQFTIKWPVTNAPNMTWEPTTGVSQQGLTQQSGGFNYATFAAASLSTTGGITGGNELVVVNFTHDNSGSGTGNFEIMADDDSQAAVNNVFYVEYFGTDATGINYANAEDVPMGYCPLTIGGSFTADNKTYDGNTDATIDDDILTLETVLGGDDVSLTGYAAQFASKDVAAGIEVSLYDNNGGTSNLSGADAGKYTLTFAGAPTTTADITAVTLTADIIGNPTKDYDGTTAATLTSANYSLDGLIGSEEITVTETSGTYDSKDAGSRTVTVTLGAEDFTAVGSTLLSNYDLPTTASGEGTINIIPLLVTADDQEKWYDGAVFTVANYTASYSGFVAGESTADLGGSLSYSGTAITATASGTYTITPAGWTSNNYDISFADGTLEIKALEFSLKAMLQGPYNTGTSFMDNLLRSNNQLPSDQPFNQDPWNYSGTETLPSPTPANAVDWVLVEFRDSNGSGYTVKGRAAGLLRTNGVIEVTVDDTEYPDLHANTDYYMVVWHRNHMPVMSATAETAPVETAFDFTQSGNLFGTKPAIELETGVDGLIAGDVTANGLLQYSGPGNDRGPIIATILADLNHTGSGINSTATGGYWFEDVTMNNVLSYMNAGNDRAPILSNLGALVSNYLNALYESVVPGVYSSAKNNTLNDGPINIRIQSNEIVLIPNDYIDQGAVDNIQFTLAWKTGDPEAEQIVEEFTSAFGLLPQGEVYETDQVSYLVFVSVDLTDLPEEWAPGQPVTAMSFEEVISDHIWIAEDQFTLDNNGMYYVSVWGKDLTGSIATGVQEGSLYRQLNVYPNPVADDHINIQMPSEITGHFTVKVFDAHGKIVCNETKLSGKQAVRLNVSHIENGVYVIQLTGDEIHYQTRFIISR